MTSSTMGKLTLVEFKEDFESNITACLSCETIVTFADLWFGSYCCKGCSGSGAKW